MNTKTIILSIAIFLFAVIGGLVMAIKGASATLFMGLLCLACGVVLVMMGFHYRKNPTYVDENGHEKTVGPAMLAMIFVLGIGLGLGGLYALAFGIPGMT